MVRTSAVWIVVGLCVCGVAAQEPEPRFDVASVRPTGNELGVTSARFVAGRYTARGFSLAQYILVAFGAQEHPLAPNQLTNAPKWIEEERFDIEATSPTTPETTRGTLSPTILAMLRSLLVERFALKAHFETKQQSVYALLLADPNGRLKPSLRRRTSECTSAARATPDTDTRGICRGSVSRGHITATGVTMTNLVAGLSRVPEIDGVVVDRTGLTGTFDLELRWSPETSSGQFALPSLNSAAPSFFTALREQLGLRLERRTESLPVLAIDSVSRLTEN
jgi:uncharacterized protein (TIGR03435 family)